MNDPHVNGQILLTINNMITNADISSEMQYLLKSCLNVDNPGGKLFRWANLTLRACECADGNKEDAISAAIAMELFALAADIFDDIQDQDNNELPWCRLSNAKALNLALGFLMLSDQALASIEDLWIFHQSKTALAQSGLIACDGQFRELLYEENQQMTLNQYFDLVGQKSGSLTACAFKLGALCSKASESLINGFGEIGMNYGIMNQIRNDLNDFLDFSKKKDFFNNTKTLPYSYLLSVLNEEQAIRFNSLADIASKRPESFREKEQSDLSQLCFEEGVAPFCQVMYEKFRQKAMELIRTIQVTEAGKEKMMKFVE